jgi:hypothetical protein
MDSRTLFRIDLPGEVREEIQGPDQPLKGPAGAGTVEGDVP